jgi:tetratricopeptide (TPR) repeat protein
MKKTLRICAVASLLALSVPAEAQSVNAVQERETELDVLFAELLDPETVNYQKVEDQIYFLWAQSGSPSADLLLERGQEAIEAQDYDLAIEHLTALTDHAPEFAEGWNARATAFYLAEEYGLALEDIKHTLALNPRHFGALSGLGVILEELGDEENALKAFRHVQALHPHIDTVNDAIERLTTATQGSTL